MPVPSTITDLSITAASNSPAGADTVTASTGPDEYLRALASIVRREQAQFTDLASATTTDLGAIATGSYGKVTGVATITGLGTIAAGIERTVVFTGILILTHNATSLILPGGLNITTAAGDAFTFRSEGSGNWRCTGYASVSGDVTLGTTQTITGAKTMTGANALNGTLGATTPAAVTATTISASGASTLAAVSATTVTTTSG
ncbi:MAG: hypothetical protein ABIU85_05585, partial [Methylotenera sp.]